jgi:hypothetical protein
MTHEGKMSDDGNRPTAHSINRDIGDLPESI